MGTKKPLSTISYNTVEYLRKVFSDLYERRIVKFYAFIHHECEADESKKHFHVYFEPNKNVDPMDIQFLLREFNEENPEKPLGCMPLWNSDSDNWIPYVLHDEGYLALKHQSREFHYNKDEIEVSDEDYYDHLYKHAFKASKWMEEYTLIKRISSDVMNPHELIDRGYLSITQASNLNAYCYMKTHYNTLNRNGHENHEDNDFN